MPYVLLDDPFVRSDFARFTARDWIERYPVAVIDEAQKLPTLPETLKAAHDLNPDVRYVLLGSSQILLLSRVRESLAGRVAIEELWPLTLPEATSSGWEAPVRPSRLIELVRTGTRSSEAKGGVPTADAGFARDAACFDRYLSDYQRTHLERDLRDLATLHDLEPFVQAQRLNASRSGKAVNFAVDAGFHAVEVKRSGRVATADARGLRDLAALLDKPLLSAVVLSQDRSVRELLPGAFAMPAAWALGGP